jgi:hypothetical protein
MSTIPIFRPELATCEAGIKGPRKPSRWREKIKAGLIWFDL